MQFLDVCVTYAEGNPWKDFNLFRPSFTFALCPMQTVYFRYVGDSNVIRESRIGRHLHPRDSDSCRG
jgi:hypothetical protein